MIARSFRLGVVECVKCLQERLAIVLLISPTSPQSLFDKVLSRALISIINLYLSLNVSVCVCDPKWEPIPLSQVTSAAVAAAPTSGTSLCCWQSFEEPSRLKALPQGPSAGQTCNTLSDFDFCHEPVPKRFKWDTGRLRYSCNVFFLVCRPISDRSFSQYFIEEARH